MVVVGIFFLSTDCQCLSTVKETRDGEAELRTLSGSSKKSVAINRPLNQNIRIS